MINKHTPIPGLRHLDAFIGKWNTVGQITDDPTGSFIKIIGTDTYEWLPGGFFLLHKVDVKIGKERNQSLEIIGFDALSNTFPMHYFDNKGNFGTMKASVHNGIWSFISEKMRFTGFFSQNGKILSGIWEQSEDGIIWKHWMDIKLTRVS